MRIRLQNQLQDALDKNFGWRVREIGCLKEAVRKHSGLARDTHIRAGVALLYAHWEGFVKTSTEHFLSFVVEQKKKYRELSVCFLLHGLSARVEMLTQSKKQQRRLEALHFIIEQLDQEAMFSTKDRINTRSNLNSAVFESIASAIGIDSSRYATKFKLMDEHLLKARNRIAHGEWVEINHETFSTLVEETLALMRWVKTDIENAATLKSYLA